MSHWYISMNIMFVSFYLKHLGEKRSKESPLCSNKMPFCLVLTICLQYHNSILMARLAQFNPNIPHIGLLNYNCRATPFSFRRMFLFILFGYFQTPQCDRYNCFKQGFASLNSCTSLNSAFLACLNWDFVNLLKVCVYIMLKLIFQNSN